MRFPVIKTKDLNKRPLTLPQDFENEFNAVLLGYQQWQQHQYETWIPFLDRLENAYPAFGYYELPIINKLNFIARYYIDEGMRAGIPNIETRSRVLTLYTDKKKLNDELSVTTEEQITILLLGPGGVVLWREEGEWTPDKSDGLDDTLLNLTPLKPDSQA